MNMNYFVELESKEMLKKEWEHLKPPKHGLKGQILQKVFSSTSYSLENVYMLTKNVALAGFICCFLLNWVVF